MKIKTIVTVYLDGLGLSAMKLAHKGLMGKPVTVCAVVRTEARVTL